MRLSTVVSIVFILHIHWACGESSTTALPQSTEKSINVGKNPAIQETQSAKDSKKSNVEPGVVLNKLLQKQQPEQEQQSGSIEDESVASNEDYSVESTPYDVGTYRLIRSVPKPQEKLPVQVRTFAHGGEIGGCRCYCPSSQHYAAAPGSYSPALPAPYLPAPTASYSAPPSPASYPGPFPAYPPPSYAFPHYPPPNAYAYARNAPENDDSELKDSVTDEARLRSAYADQPEYPAPAPAPAASYAQPSPAPQTYAPPAPSAKCGQNLLIGCSPTVSTVPCSSPPSY